MALAMGKEVSAAASELISGERRGGDLVVTFSLGFSPLYSTVVDVIRSLPVHSRSLCAHIDVRRRRGGSPQSFAPAPRARL